MPRLRPFTAAAVLALAVAHPARAQAPAPRDELVRLVPDDIAFCLVVQDLRTQGDKLMKSPWVQALKASPLLKGLGDAPELLKLAEVGKELKKRLQIDWAQLRDEVLGDAVVVAYSPGPPGHPEQEQGLLLLHARSPAVLAKLVDRINAEQLRTGELKALKPRDHKGTKYYHRAEVTGDQFYCLDGPFLAFSSQEAMLRKVLDRRADATRPAVPMLAQLAAAGCDKALGSLWINPRAFDALLRAQVDELGNSPEAKSLRTFLGYWKAVEGVSLSLQVPENPQFVVAVHARPDLLPAPAQKLVAEAAKPSDVWTRLPADAVLTIASRTDFAALVDTLEELLPGEAEDGLTELLQKTLGLPVNKELLKEFAPFLGPDWGFCVANPPAKDDFPHAILALRVRSGGDRPDAKTLVRSLQLAATIAVNEYNRKHKDQIRLKSLKQGDVEVKYLVNEEKFPRGFQPAFALKDGYLVVASSPQALERFTAPREDPPAGAASPLLRLSFKGLATLVKDRRDVVVGFLKDKRKLNDAAVEKRYQALTAALELFDRAELEQRADGDRVVWVFRLQTAAPAKGPPQ